MGPVNHKFPTITLTGVDERTDQAWMKSMLDKHPRLEFGVLLTKSPEGRRRYPELEFIRATVDAFPMRCAVHVCGSQAKLALLHGELDHCLANAARIQINGAIRAENLRRCCAKFSTKKIITQHGSSTDAALLGLDAPNHQLLVDGSGGRGIAPASWIRPSTLKDVGFAGGLGPEGLGHKLDEIARTARGAWWIDMEQKLRDDHDWLNQSRCEQVLHNFAGWLDQHDRVIDQVHMDELIHA